MTKFYKYQGTGNDFVMIDNRTNAINLNKEDIHNICHRRFGVGADGLILIENQHGYDFKMRYFNADGAEGSMCGNGGRCAVSFAKFLNIFETNTTFIAVDGEHAASIDNDFVTLKMGKPSAIENFSDDYYIHTGSPHLVKFVDNLENFEVKIEGAKIRYSDFWMQRGGTNVNFVQVIDGKSLFVRTYERGVEDETYSCGTGVTASALVASAINMVESPVEIKTLGGNLAVSFDKNNFEDIYLSGPSIQVFEGILYEN